MKDFIRFLGENIPARFLFDLCLVAIFFWLLVLVTS